MEEIESVEATQADGIITDVEFAALGLSDALLKALLDSVWSGITSGVCSRFTRWA